MCKLQCGLLDDYLAGSAGLCAHVFRECRTGTVYLMGSADLYGGDIFSGIPVMLSAELCGIGTGKDQSVSCLSEKINPADSVNLFTAGISGKQSVCSISCRTGQRYSGSNSDDDCIFKQIQWDFKKRT